MPLNKLQRTIWLQIKELRERDNKLSIGEIAHKLCIDFYVVETLIKFK